MSINIPRIPQARIRPRHWDIITSIARTEQRPISNVIEVLLDKGIAAGGLSDIPQFMANGSAKRG